MWCVHFVMNYIDKNLLKNSKFFIFFGLGFRGRVWLEKMSNTDSRSTSNEFLSRSRFSVSLSLSFLCVSLLIL